MQTTQLVFDVIDKISYPVILLEENEKKEWSESYINQAMGTVLKRKSADKEKKVDLTDSEISLKKLIDKYNEQEHRDSYTLHDVDIFDGVYNVHFNHNQKQLLIIFMQIPTKELFNNITFNDFSGACNSIMIVLDSGGNIVDTNEYFSNLVKMKKELVLGKNFFETFMPTYIDKLSPYLNDILTKDSYSQHFVTPLKDSNGKNYRINWQVSKIIKGEQTYVIAVGSDITKFIEENSDLKLKLTSIKVGFDYFPLAIGYMNASGKFITTNPRFKEMFHIEDSDEKIMFDQIAPLVKHQSFEKTKEYLGLIKEMSYNIKYDDKGKEVNLKVDIRLLASKKASSNFYIVVVQKIN
ncbi:MAG: PAS domain S-box protein [Sulfurimonas sp.]|uniref:PAS domain S-box protein n=1 Tax=Sulfurimonas sp. TaxID=2022749 RepID=UPI00260E22DB|nr:PAS domain S-box protein [Sulfurimonas sp.]MCW8895715.1 PAS domain S-box protein [Sulfurimonas sp.]MCW8953685.1 PAS domain S-box protein [Sulfurimonas sp.]MCW9068237.1 PAS domain S-box protein [Sulfurimonas sp.]